MQVMPIDPNLPSFRVTGIHEAKKPRRTTIATRWHYEWDDGQFVYASGRSVIRMMNHARSALCIVALRCEMQTNREMVQVMWWH